MASVSDGGNAAAVASALPCAAPSEAPGVTDSEISIGTIASLTGPVPGLGAGSVAAIQAYAAYRNSQGGVCGRQVQIRTADDGTDGGRYRTLVNELEPQVLGFVVGIAGGDAGGEELLADLAVPYAGLLVTPDLYALPNVFGISPPFRDVNVATGRTRFLYEQGVRTAALVYLGVAQVRAEIDRKHRHQIEAAGIQIVSEQALPLSTLSYDSAARGVANSGADYLLFVGSWDQGANMARSMADTGYDLMFAEYVSSYGSPFIEVAQSAAEGTMSWPQTLPNEDGGQVPEQAAFLEWMALTAPDVSPDRFAAEAWTVAKAFFDSLQAIPGPITRDALLSQMTALTAYDAGGLLGPIDFGGKVTGGCSIGMIVEGGAWRRLTPAQGFLC